MNAFNLKYDQPLFRPPSEAFSLILQITLGCSHNKCAFCEMYTDKKFKVRNIDDIIREVREISFLDNSYKKVFLADGDAMVLSTEKLKKILDTINEYLPKVRRISAYAKPKDLANKTVEELKLLNDAGLDLVYVGIESGDNELLKLINKGETFDSTVKGLQNAKAGGIRSSVMILNGLGGKKYSIQHAKNSAEVVNLTQPEYLSTLVLSFPYGLDHFKSRFAGEYEPMNSFDLIKEMRVFIENTNLEKSIFRSDHASNYLILKGVLSKDKQKILDSIDFALENPQNARLRPEWLRGL